MADLTKNSPDVEGTSALRCVYIAGLLAGETIAKGDMCYIKSDGKIWRAVSTVHDGYTVETGDTDYAIDVTRFVGVANGDYVAGDAVTLFGRGAIISKYGSSLTIGNSYFISDTVGKLATAQVATGDYPVAISISATDILITR